MEILEKAGLHVAVTWSLWAVVSPALAATTTLTGADIFNDPSAVFPAGTQSLSGSSLIVGASSNEADRTVLEIPIFPAGSLSAQRPLPLQVSVNLTRLTSDFDPTFALSDGNTSLGGTVRDNLITSFFENGLIVNQAAIPNATFPEVNSAFDFNLSFLQEDSETTVNLSFSFADGSRSHDSSFVLDTNSDLTLVLVSDNDTIEQYQINSLTFSSSDAVPEPLTLLGSMVGIGFGIVLRKKYASTKPTKP